MTNRDWFNFFNLGSNYVALINNKTLQKVYFTLDEYKELVKKGELEKNLPNKKKTTEQLKQIVLNKEFDPYISYIINTGNCNLNCDYCYIEPIAKQFKLSKEEADKIIDLIRKSKTTKISFYGGEPLLNKEVIYYMLEKLKDLKIKKNIITNGTFVNEEFAKKMKENKVNVSISLDGGYFDNIHRHDKKEAFYRALRGISILKNEGLKIGLSVTITKDNVHRLPKIIEFVYNLGIRGMGFNILLRTKENKHLAANPKTLAYFLYKAMKKAFELGVYEDRTMRRFKPFIEEKFKYFDCPWVGASAINFGKNAEIAGCQAFLAERSKEHTYSTIKDYVKSLNEIKKIATPFNQKCNKCPAFGICGGVCPYHVLINTGKLGVIDEEFCTYVKETLKYFIDFYYLNEIKKVEIKEIEDKDFLGLKELFKSLKKDSLMTINNPEELATEMLKIKELRYGKVLAIKESNKLIGFANAVFMEPGRMEVGVGFLKEYRKKDIGTKAIKQLEKKLKAAHSTKRITLTAKVKKENIGSKKMFEKLGYRKEEENNSDIIFSKKLML